MEKIKEFVKEHKKEIAIVAGSFIIYRIGFRHGCKASNRAIKNLVHNIATELPNPVNF